ncbi:SH3 domain-containing protein [Oscillatoria sp. FACHB-1407]|uniref:SH3 domain-containing protein n=1 Tax=Oscillatoria sp. FACHB-1407 TaxID=2692847 RepID=UPI001685F6C2|nr:SH3 domain-containing protein [Oscillatoria sp. FACHB-1407]MBD2462415.1 SH3 domain-containing protein [Oscillatoria sp. FACHB-1407]
MSWSGLIKFFTGFTLAIALLFFAGVNVTRHLITRLTAPPPRPVFPNDTPSPVASAAASTPQTQATPSPAASAAPPVERSPSPNEAGAFEARVTEPIGLIVRQEPSRDAERLGGVEYDEVVTVLETTSDGEWQRVRLSGSGVEGWVKAGNVEQISE